MCRSAARATTKRVRSSLEVKSSRPRELVRSEHGPETVLASLVEIDPPHVHLTLANGRGS